MHKTPRPSVVIVRTDNQGLKSDRSSYEAMMLRNQLLLLIFVVISCVLTGCGTSPLPPPVSISIRNSVFSDDSKVIQITNDSSHHLYNVQVVGRNFEEVSSGSVRAAEELKPGRTVEVGWLEFEHWVPRSGETVEVYCDNYVMPMVKIIP